MPLFVREFWDPALQWLRTCAPIFNKSKVLSDQIIFEITIVVLVRQKRKYILICSKGILFLCRHYGCFSDHNSFWNALRGTKRVQGNREYKKMSRNLDCSNRVSLPNSINFFLIPQTIKRCLQYIHYSLYMIYSNNSNI